MHPMLTIAIRAARKAGNLIAKNYETPDAVEASQKGSNDFVTNVDRDAEHLIIDVIRKSYPKHTIISEECGELVGEDDDVQWVIDPLDGTTNFIKRLPILQSLLPCALKAGQKSPWFTIQCVTNCSPPAVVKAPS